MPLNNLELSEISGMLFTFLAAGLLFGLEDDSPFSVLGFVDCTAHKLNLIKPRSCAVAELDSYNYLQQHKR